MEPAIGWTYSDYCKLPEDGVRYELFEGFLSREPAPSTTHQVIVRRLMLSLAEHLGPTRAEGLFTAPLAVVFSDNTVVQPDVIYVTPERAAVIRNDGVFGPPDLVFEVLSPSTRERDLTTKRQLYAYYELPEYWAIDPGEKQALLFFEPAAGQYNGFTCHSLGDTAFSPATGYTLCLQQLFRAPDHDW